MDDDDERVFNAIIVISDRRVLNKQLQATVRAYEKTRGLVAVIDGTSAQLKKPSNLENKSSSPRSRSSRSSLIPLENYRASGSPFSSMRPTPRRAVPWHRPPSRC